MNTIYHLHYHCHAKSATPALVICRNPSVFRELLADFSLCFVLLLVVFGIFKILCIQHRIRNKNKLNGTYIYRHKHNYIPCSTFTITKLQLHVSAINVGHLQVVNEELINKLYQHVWGFCSLWGGVGACSCYSTTQRG